MKKKPLIITIAIAFILAMVTGFLFLRKISGNNETSSDSSIVKVEDDEDDDTQSSDVDVSLQYAGSATLFLDENLISLNFTNPSRSKKSLSLDIVANVDGEDIILGKSEKIRPGYKIDSIKYEPNKEIQKGEYKGKFIIHFYGDEDKEEIVSSEIAIKIYVR